MILYTVVSLLLQIVVDLETVNMAESEVVLPKPEEVLSFSVAELKGLAGKLGLEVTSNMGKKELQVI